jgi:membrane-associated protease RseP (regulator of RpoE activity)
MAARPASNRLIGGNVEPVASVRHVRFGGVDFPAMPAALVPDSVSKADSAVLSGGLSLSMLSAFRVIVDYPHDRLYLIPAAGAADIKFQKDRLGLLLAKQGDTYDVTFVSTNSPAQAAGLKVGDKIALIDGKRPEDWPLLALTNLRFASAGTTHTFTLKGGAVKQVKAMNFY